MKKYLFLFLFCLALSGLQAQNNTNSTLVRHDTSSLRPGDHGWIIKSGKSLSQFLLDAIEKGKIKAFDATTNEPIPAKKIFTWRMPADSMMVTDPSGNPKIVVVQRKHSSEKIDEIKIYHDWYLDVATGKLRSAIKLIELRERIYSSVGDLLGYGVFCKIYY